MKKRKKDAANMFFSAFLVFAYVVCSYFLLQFITTLTNQTLMESLVVLIVAVFGLLLFYATRVGDGKQVLRFSPSVLILIVLPAIYVISAYFAVGLPLHTQIAKNTTLIYLAAVALGYGIPYTFTSGFELVSAEDVFFPKDDEEETEEEVESEETEETEESEADEEADKKSESEDEASSENDEDKPEVSNKNTGKKNKSKKRK